MNSSISQSRLTTKIPNSIRSEKEQIGKQETIKTLSPSMDFQSGMHLLFISLISISWENVRQDSESCSQSQNMVSVVYFKAYCCHLTERI